MRRLHSLTIIAVAALVSWLCGHSAFAQKFAEQEGVEVRFDGKCLYDPTTFPGNAGRIALIGCIVNNNSYEVRVEFTVDWACQEHYSYSSGKAYPRTNSKWDLVSAYQTKAFFVDVCGQDDADRHINSVRITAVRNRGASPPPASSPPAAYPAPPISQAQREQQALQQQRVARDAAAAAAKAMERQRLWEQAGRNVAPTLEALTKQLDGFSLTYTDPQDRRQKTTVKYAVQYAPPSCRIYIGNESQRFFKGKLERYSSEDVWMVLGAADVEDAKPDAANGVWKVQVLNSFGGGLKRKWYRICYLDCPTEREREGTDDWNEPGGADFVLSQELAQSVASLLKTATETCRIK